MSLRLPGGERSPYALLSAALGMPTQEVRRIARAAPTLYRTRFELKPTGGFRRIQAPHAALKQLQRRLLRWIESRANWHPAATAGVPRASQRKNALPHQRQYMLATEDVADFFPSINAHRVKRVLEKCGMQPEVAALVRTLTTRHEALPQGAPTSSLIANLVLRGMDERIDRWARRRGLRYTRYVDDITVSGDHDFEDQLPQLWEIVTGARFALRPDKRTCLGPEGEHVVTKTISVEKGLRISTGYESRIAEVWTRSERLIAQAGGRSAAQRMTARLRGMIEHARHIDRVRGTQLLTTFFEQFPAEFRQPYSVPRRAIRRLGRLE